MPSDEKVNVCVLVDAAGPSVYIDNHLIAGPKPWGDEDVVYEWNADRAEVLTALGFDRVE